MPMSAETRKKISAARKRYWKRVHRDAENHDKAISHIKQGSHFYRLKGTELIPVKVKKIVAWVIE